MSIPTLWKVIANSNWEGVSTAKIYKGTGNSGGGGGMREFN